MKSTNWFLVCLDTGLNCQLTSFPLSVGRNVSQNEIVINSPFVSSVQFILSKNILGVVKVVNKAVNNPTFLDGCEVADSMMIPKDDCVHIITASDTVMGIGQDIDAIRNVLLRYNEETGRNASYFFKGPDSFMGPYGEEQLLGLAEQKVISPNTPIFPRTAISKPISASDIIDFSNESSTSETLLRQHEFVGQENQSSHKAKRVYSEEVKPVLGESFACPYCRVVSNIEDLLSVSVSPALMGDPILGEYEQSRFLPTQFNSNGLALDSRGGVCTEIACPNCHMSFSQELLNSPQVMMSVIGAPGAGKSVFLASAVWQCRQILMQKFGVGFFDLDPVANRWINAYEEKFFFQSDTTVLQQIAKTDLSDSNLTKSVLIDERPFLLPLPSFFQVKPKNANKAQNLLIYDSAGEHFRAGADTNESSVTLNMLNADVLYFMFDPSADPRFRAYINRGNGTAENYAQRQDTLLSEMVARIRRHFGTRAGMKLKRPLIMGISKADLLRDHLNLNDDVYHLGDDGTHMLNLDALKRVSDSAEALIMKIAPEVVSTARDIADEVWFLPVSSLGHNPMREGVCVTDIKPVWAELPIVFTLARRGIIKSYKSV